MVDGASNWPAAFRGISAAARRTPGPFRDAALAVTKRTRYQFFGLNYQDRGWYHAHLNA
jgi:hypothetical protein